MSREKCLEEMMISMVTGMCISILVISICHEMFCPVELAAFWFGTWCIATYAVWSIIDWVDKKKGRDTGLNGHSQSI